MKKALIVRGLPGAGKSTVVQSVINSFVERLRNDNLNAAQKPLYVIHSTDSYFVLNGAYQFDASKLPEFHQRNQDAFKQSLRKNVSLVICDNTNIERWQREPYIDAALAAGYEVEIMTVGLFSSETLHQTYVKRNQHLVSIEVIKDMASKAVKDGIVPETNLTN
jgi:predicted kinase